MGRRNARTCLRNPRRAEGKRYALHHILLFTILAIVSGADSYRTVQTFIKLHRQKLNKAFGIKWKRAPHYSSLSIILPQLSVEDVEKAFREHASNLNQAPANSTVRAVGIDGKVLRKSFDNFKESKAKQILSAFAVDTALILAHIDIEDKSNEIPAAQKLLAELDLAGQIVTLDAMHRQKNLRRGGRSRRPSDRPGQSQPAGAARQDRERLRRSPPGGGLTTVDKSQRNRHETRVMAVYNTLPAVAGTEWEGRVAAIARVERLVFEYQPLDGMWKPSWETSYYASNKPVAVQTAAEAIRRHWHIENKQHYVRDVTMDEDASRIRNNPGIFSRMRSFGLNLLRFNQRDTIAQDRYAAAFGGLNALFKMRFSIEN